MRADSISERAGFPDQVDVRGGNIHYKFINRDLLFHADVDGWIRRRSSAYSHSSFSLGYVFAGSRLGFRQGGETRGLL